MAGLSRKSGAPLHHQLFSILRTGIVAQRYREGELLPSEDSLVGLYKVSRTTVRRALQALADKGMIERSPGIGTRVLPPVGVIFGASADINMIGPADDDIHLSTLEFEFVPAPRDVATQLELSAGETILKICRLRTVDGVPVRITTHYLAEKLGAKLTEEMLGQNLLLDILATFGVIGQRAVDTIGAVLGDPSDASLLVVEVGAPLLELTRVVFTKLGEPFLVQTSLVPPERQKLRIESEGDEKGLIPIGGKGIRVPVRWL